eukprot:scaffold248218_cov35-Tisochrysis_lutea.AAC.2
MYALEAMRAQNGWHRMTVARVASSWYYKHFEGTYVSSLHCRHPQVEGWELTLKKLPIKPSAGTLKNCNLSLLRICHKECSRGEDSR